MLNLSLVLSELAGICWDTQYTFIVGAQLPNAIAMASVAISQAATKYLHKSDWEQVHHPNSDTSRSDTNTWHQINYIISYVAYVSVG